MEHGSSGLEMKKKARYLALLTRCDDAGMQLVDMKGRTEKS